MPGGPWDPQKAHDAYKKRQNANPNDKTSYTKKPLFGKEERFEGRDAVKESRRDKKRWST